VVTDPQTHTPTNKQTQRQDRLQYTAPQLASAQCKMLLFQSNKTDMHAITTYPWALWTRQGAQISEMAEVDVE